MAVEHPVPGAIERVLGRKVLGRRNRTEAIATADKIVAESSLRVLVPMGTQKGKQDENLWLVVDCQHKLSLDADIGLVVFGGKGEDKVHEAAEVLLGHVWHLVQTGVEAPRDENLLRREQKGSLVGSLVAAGNHQVQESVFLGFEGPEERAVVAVVGRYAVLGPFEGLELVDEVFYSRQQGLLLLLGGHGFEFEEWWFEKGKNLTNRLENAMFFEVGPVQV